MSLTVLTLTLAALTGLAANDAGAQVRTAQFAVRAQVVADCQITTQDLNFGNYSANAESSASTPLNLRCTPGTGATVSLDAGSSGNPQRRHMTGPAELEYELYRDAAHDDAIDSMGMAFQLKANDNDGQPVIFMVHGGIPANQTVPAGNYTDTIRVTVNY